MNATCCHCQPEHFILWQIREKELNYYSQNCLAVGTQAALLAGFAYSGLTQVAIPLDSEYVLKLLYLLMTTTAMCLELIAVMNTTLLSMMGPGLALRGPDGAMDKAVEGLALEYRNIFLAFALGITFFLFSAVVFVFEETGEGGSFDWLQSVLMFLIFFVTIRAAVKSCKRIYKKFRIRAEHAVSGNFHFNAPRGS